MREIKFRAWDSIQNVMRGWDWLKDKQGTYLNSKYFHAMQYTGLKDKNGKEIYEGDIVDFGRGKGDVYFYKGRFWVRDFFCPSFDDPSDAFGEGKGNLEVIGNLYENPELIKTI